LEGVEKNLKSNPVASPTFSPSNNTKKYLDIVPVLPFYRIYFEDGTFFDYDGGYQSTIDQIKELANEEEAKAFEEFHRIAVDVFEEGFLELGFQHFSTPVELLKVLPKLNKLDVIRSLYSYVEKYFKHPKTKQIFSFETLLIGGNPVSVPALYVMIHFVEKTWAIHYAMGGTGKLINAFVKKFKELGGEIKYDSEVKEILTASSPSLNPLAKKATGVRVNNEVINADIVCSNADYHHTYSKLVKASKLFNSSLKVKHLTKYSNSLFVIYFAFKKDKDLDSSSDLRHHNIILGGDYLNELNNIYNKGSLTEKFSQYLHVPTITDPGMAPKGYHTAYTLLVVPNKKTGKQDWSEISEKLKDKVINFLEQKRYIPNLSERLVHASFIDPDYFENTLNSYQGNAFGTAPLFRHSAFLRPHNRSWDVKNLYCVGASYQPGAGTPSVMMSAKMTAKLIFDNLN
jgi:phytoene desaturase